MKHAVCICSVYRYPELPCEETESESQDMASAQWATHVYHYEVLPQWIKGSIPIALMMQQLMLVSNTIDIQSSQTMSFCT